MMKFILLIIFSSYTFASLLVVSSKNCNFNNLNQNDLKNLYLGLTTEVNNQEVMIYDRDEKNLHDEFIVDYLKKTPILIKKYWVRMLFTGRGKPPKKITIQEWNDILKDDKCSIFYILPSEYNSDLKRINLSE